MKRTNNESACEKFRSSAGAEEQTRNYDQNIERQRWLQLAVCNWQTANQ
jgi:hypothetical protein